jgi:hypothetical protein
MITAVWRYWRAFLSATARLWTLRKRGGAA